ncbi:MAG: DUF1800 domain-containing protein [Dehalococcoidia bacterium]
MDPSADGVPEIAHRRTTRRAVLFAGGGLAAAAAAAAVANFAGAGGGAVHTSESPPPPPTAGDAGTAAVATTATPVATVASPSPLADPLKRAAHLLRRAGFGGAQAEVERFAALSREEAANRLVDYAAVDNGALNARIAAANFTLRITDEAGQRGQAIRDMQRWWLTRMAYTARPLEERMTFIWHGMLTSQVSKVGPLRARLLVDQIELYRSMATGRFDDLIQAVSKDPAMMTYLDTVESTKEHPNENYPRELLELFTMGIGNYTEDDVREASRAFTGWRLTPPPRPDPAAVAGLNEAERDALRRKLAYEHNPAFRLQANQHDYGQKTFLGKTGAWGGEDIVRIVMEQPATARFVCERLWSELAYSSPETPVVDRLVAVWDKSGHSIAELVRAILVSDEFYSDRAYFGKVRSPVELLVGLIRGLELDSALELQQGRGRQGGGFYQAMDQVLFEPPNVAGWPGGPLWLSSSTWFARLNFLDQFLFPRGRAVAVPGVGGSTPEALVDAIAGRLIDGGLAGARRAAVIDHVSAVREPAERAATAAYLVAASPEYQLI